MKGQELLGGGGGRENSGKRNKYATATKQRWLEITWVSAENVSISAGESGKVLQRIPYLQAKLAQTYNRLINSIFLLQNRRTSFGVPRGTFQGDVIKGASDI